MCLKSNFFAIKLFCGHYKHKGNNAFIFVLPFQMSKRISADTEHLCAAAYLKPGHFQWF